MVPTPRVMARAWGRSADCSILPLDLGIFVVVLRRLEPGRDSRIPAHRENGPFPLAFLCSCDLSGDFGDRVW